MNHKDIKGKPVADNDCVWRKTSEMREFRRCEGVTTEGQNPGEEDCG